MRADAERSRGIPLPMKGGEDHGRNHKVKTDNG